MDLKGIISISGKPGLYKVAAQGRNNIIVQSLENEKKFPAFSNEKISALDDISVYTYEKDVPLSDVLQLLADKEQYKKSINHKEDAKKLRTYLTSFLPDYDAERVYDTDVKKIFQWYNILIEKGIISEEAAKAAAEKAKVDETEKIESEEKVKKPAAKTKTDAPKKVAKSTKPKADTSTDSASKSETKKKSTKKS